MSDLTIVPTHFVGCDVGKAAITVFDSATGLTREVPNTMAALAELAATLDPHSLAICETTGGYEALLLDALVRAGRAVHRADARKVKAFIRSLGTLAKTDAIDARALARYGQERHDRLERWHPCEHERHLLHTLVATRTDLVRARTAHAHRLRAPGAAPVTEELRTLLAGHDHAIATLDARIEALIHASSTLGAAVRVLRAIPGSVPPSPPRSSPICPNWEPSAASRSPASPASPRPRQSGATNSYRRTHGGRPDVKRTLFMAVLAAVRHHPTLRPFHQRLIANGKKPIVALVATMRKLITIANAKLRDHLHPQLS